MKNKIILSITMATMLLVGCEKSFFDINENPNLPTEESVEPRLLLPMVLNASAKKMAIDYSFLGHWVGYWAKGRKLWP